MTHALIRRQGYVRTQPEPIFQSLHNMQYTQDWQQSRCMFEHCKESVHEESAAEHTKLKYLAKELYSSPAVKAVCVVYFLDTQAC